MMRFQNFEVLYEAACNIGQAVSRCEDRGIRISVESSVRKQKEVLRKQFAANFPASWEEAEKHPDWDATQFFDMLQKWVELENKERIKSLVTSMMNHKVSIPDSARRILLAYAFSPDE